jgi:hypothetical protein
VGRLANETPTTRDEHEAGAAQTSRQAGRPASGRVGSGASLLPSCPRCPPTSEALHGLAREAAKAKATAKWWQMGMRSVHEALGKWGSTDLQLYTHDVHCTAAGAASSGGRGGASSAAACPSLGGRTPASFTTARRPRTRTAERLLAGPPRRACVAAGAPTPASSAGHARRQACERRAAGWRVPAEPTILRLNSQVLGLSRVRSNVRWSAATPLYYMPFACATVLYYTWWCASR